MEDLLGKILSRAEGRDRYLIGIAGAPASGKSTLATRLARELPAAALVPMDGFHYDNAVLDELGLRNRKGAPETFDCAGYSNTLNRIREREACVAVPLFDREKDLARACAALVTKEHRFVITEGNYLLLDEEPWRGLSKLLDLTIFLDVPRLELECRLLARWADLGWPAERARHWIDSNDLPNAERVLSRKLPADIVLQGTA